MDLHRYGPFANVVAIASALAATFSIFLLKTVGTVARWTWLGSGAPSFLVTAAARFLAVALMAITYVTISKSNYLWFGGGAVLYGLVGFIAIIIFERLRQRHVVLIPMVDMGGGPLLDRKNRPVQQNVVVGLESDIREDVKPLFTDARQRHPGLSVLEFMRGFGGHPNDPDALWDSALLADIRSKLTITLMCVLLFGVMAVFTAAFIVEVFNR